MLISVRQLIRFYVTAREQGAALQTAQRVVSADHPWSQVLDVPPKKCLTCRKLFPISAIHDNTAQTTEAQRGLQAYLADTGAPFQTTAIQHIMQ